VHLKGPQGLYPRCAPSFIGVPRAAEHVIGEGLAEGEVLHRRLGLQLLRPGRGHLQSRTVTENLNIFYPILVKVYIKRQYLCQNNEMSSIMQHLNWPRLGQGGQREEKDILPKVWSYIKMYTRVQTGREWRKVQNPGLSGRKEAGPQSEIEWDRQVQQLLRRCDLVPP
jgi:hypothetical protein